MAAAIGADTARFLISSGMRRWSCSHTNPFNAATAATAATQEAVQHPADGSVPITTRPIMLWNAA